MDSKLKRLFWAWHFWVGFLIGPILILMAVTGAIYIFQPEIDHWLHADVMSARDDFLRASGPATALAPAIEQAKKLAGPGSQIQGLDLDVGTGKAPAIYISTSAVNNKPAGGKKSSKPSQPKPRNTSSKKKPTKPRARLRKFYVDPNTGALRGEVPRNEFFRTVLMLHRNLMAGKTGRLFTELTVGWTIAAIGMGLVLWWPRSWKSLKGVLIPRSNAKRYTWLRDFHAIGGFWVSWMILIIALTGLLYTSVWGPTYRSLVSTGQGRPPALKSVSGAEAPLLDPDQVLARLASLEIPTDRLRVLYPRKPDGVISLIGSYHYGPNGWKTVHLDRSTGEVLKVEYLHDQSVDAIYRRWNFPVHVGSFGGLTTKILWLIACVMLTALPIFGYMMWWTRRKKGSLGLPKKVEVSKPWWLWITLLIFAVFLPVAGATLVAVLLLGALTTGVKRLFKRQGSPLETATV